MEQERLTTDRQLQKLVVGGRATTTDDITLMIERSADERERTLLIELRDFLLEWFTATDAMTVHTSGSTGTPKPIEVSKERMIQSALATCKRLGLKHGDTALLCMPVRYIAGRMMVVRSLVAGLNLIIVPPSGHPLKDVEQNIDFAAMIPLQVCNSLGNECECGRLFNVRKLIIGGGPVDDKLSAALQTSPGEIYATYGMTETLSHIALRRINGAEASELYYPLPGVELSVSKDDTLIIDAPRICSETLVTNDVIMMSADGGFVIKGRKDNIINSGGIKVQIEEVERLLRNVLTTQFAVTAVADERLGEAITLLIETDDKDTGYAEDVFASLPQYWRPRHIFRISSLPLTETGKTDRAACRRLAADINATSGIGTTA